MKGPPAKRQEILEQIADYVLKVGLTGLSLRPLASAIGTSDRMLLYYFSDKDELVSETVKYISNQLLNRLQSEILEPEPFNTLLPRIYFLLINDDYRPYMQIWYELVALSARNEEPFKAITGQIVDTFLNWVAAQLKIPDDIDRSSMAALLLGTIEGFFLLEYVGKGNISLQAFTRIQSMATIPGTEGMTDLDSKPVPDEMLIRPQDHKTTDSPFP